MNFKYKQILFLQAQIALIRHALFEKLPDGSFFRVTARVFIFFFLLMDQAPDLNAQPGYFEKRFGGSGVQVAQSAVQGTDSALFLFGYAANGPIGDYDMCLMKISPSGDSVWTRYYGTSRVDFGISINAYGSGAFVLIGSTQDSLVQNADDVMMILVDTSGNEIWRKIYGGIGSQGCRWVEATADSGFIFCGFSPDAFGSNDAWVVKTDATGAVQWSGLFGGPDNDAAMRVIATTDSTWAVTCDTKQAGNGDYDVEVIGLNRQGQVLFDNIHVDSLTNGCQGMMLTSAGKLVSFGETEIYPNSFFDFQLHVFDNQGNYIRNNTFGGSGADAMFDMIECDNGDWLGTGYSNSVSGGTQPIDLALVRLDSSGNVQWIRQYGGSGIDLGYSLIKSVSGGYYAAGRGTGQDEDFYLLYFGEDGLLGQGELLNTNGLKVYPNPSYHHVRIESGFDMYRWDIYDASGRLCHSREEDSPVSFISLDVRSWYPGIYFARVYGKNRNSFARFSVLH